MLARSARGDLRATGRALASRRVIAVLRIVVVEEHSIDILAASRAEQLDPGVRANWSPGAPRPRLGDERSQRPAFAPPADWCDRSVDAGGGEIRGHHSERPTFERQLPSGSGVAAQPGQAAFGRDDEEEDELRTNREDRRPGAELGVDLRRVLGRFVDLQTEDCRATVSLENDDTVRPSREEARVPGDRLRKPQLDRRWHLLSPGDANHGANSFHAIERMTHVGEAADPRLCVPEPSESLASESVRERHATTPWR